MDIDDIASEFEMVFDQVMNGGNENNLICINSSSPETSDDSEQGDFLSTNATTKKYSDNQSVNLDSSSDLIRTSSEVLCDSGPSKDMSLNCLDNSTSQSPVSPISPLAVTLQTTSDCPPISTASSSPQPTPLCSAGVSLVIGNLKWSTALTEIIARLTIGHQVQVCMDESAYDMCNRQAYSLIWLLVNPPVNQEILSLTTSIRYFSKYNKKTIVIGVSHTKITVDLQLHGIDEIVVQPVTKSIVQNKYSKLTSVQLNQAEQVTEETCSSDTSSCAENSTNNLVGVDGNEGLQPQIPEYDQHATRLGQTNTTTVTDQLKSPNLSNGNDHTAKEKLRRERIKESCSQLRVLLPYVRGWKTDMASILELGVKYIKVVNAILPQELQSQIINILSKDYVLKEHARECNQPNMISTRKTTVPIQNVTKTNKDQDYTSNKLTLVPEFCQRVQVQRLDYSSSNVATSPIKRPNYKMDGTASTEYLETDDTHLQYATHKEPRLEITGTAESNVIPLIKYKNNFKDHSIPSRMTTTVSTNMKPIQSSIFNPEIRLIPVANDNTSKKNEVKQDPPMHVCPYSIPICQTNDCSIHKHIAPVGPQTQLFCPPRQYVNSPNLYIYPSSYFGNSVTGQTDGNFVARRCNFKQNEFQHSNIPMYYHCSNNETPNPNSIKIVQMSNASQSSFYNRAIADEPLPADYSLNIPLDTLPSDETNELFNVFKTLANTPTRTSDTSLHEQIPINNNKKNDDCDNKSNNNSYTINRKQAFNNFEAFQQMPGYSPKHSED